MTRTSMIMPWEAMTAATISNTPRRAPAPPRSAASLPPAPRSFVKSRFGQDFSQVQTHASGIFFNGPSPGSPPGPPARTAGTCPTDIRVARVEPLNDRDFGQKTPITGWGGIAVMEVSDPSGKDWAGTKIHENLKSVGNTCGEQGKNACSNQSGENGKTGSSFEVGKESNFLGLASLPAAKNRFYDLHVFMKRGSSLLHQLNKPTCEVQCEQSFDCDGRRLGPEFVITYVMTRDSVSRQDGGFNAVTRVQVRKAAKSVPPAAQGTNQP